MSDLEELRRLSEAATPGPWSTDRAMLVEFLDRNPQNATDFRFIVALVNAYRDGYLSNPTSSVSTEGVAEALAMALRANEQDVDLAATPWGEQVPEGWRHRDLARRILEAEPRLRLAINPDSPVEPSDG